jgi:sphinganine-1-phosphate aldolase
MGTKIPSEPVEASTILERITNLQRGDARWDKGRLFSLVYHHSDTEFGTLLEGAYLSCFALNGLGMRAFPSLAQMEREVVEMAAELLGAPEAPGSFTSGGTESNFLAVKTARDWARLHRPNIVIPEMVLAASAHPSFNKAAHYLGVRAIRVPVDGGQRADLNRIREAVGPNTILIVGSAPSWPHGVVDPISALASLAREREVLLHVDACLGGFLLPFARRLGRPVPDFDLSVEGVTSISADIHKFGYAPKGASIVLYRDQTLYDFQPFVFDDWTGGVYSVPTFAGSRPGGAIAAAWAAMNGLGDAGYRRLTDRCLRAATRLMEGIRAISGLYIVADPQYNIFAFGSRDRDIAGVWSGMSRAGWVTSLQGKPPSNIHLTVAPDHDRVAEEFLDDLRGAVRQAAPAGAAPPESRVARYN